MKRTFGVVVWSNSGYHTVQRANNLLLLAFDALEHQETVKKGYKLLVTIGIGKF